MGYSREQMLRQRNSASSTSPSLSLVLYKFYQANSSNQSTFENDHVVLHEGL